MHSKNSTASFTVTTYSREQTIELGKKIGERLTGGEVIALSGTLAAGKTTFTKGIALALGVDEEITSPTFTIISEYTVAKFQLYHMDMYRITDMNDFIDLGIDDMLYGSGVCVIEWSEKVIDELPPHTIKIHIELDGKNSETRNITISGINFDLDTGSFDTDFFDTDFLEERHS